jgi:EpsI family protein
MRTDSAVQIPAPQSTPAPLEVFRNLWLKVVLALLLVGGVLFSTFAAGDVNSDSEPGVIMHLPERVGDFVGTPEEASEAERVILPSDTEIARMRYEDPKGNAIVASIVLSGGEKRSIHRPEVCLPGQGWSIGSGSKLAVPLAGGKDMDVMMLNISRPVEARPGEIVRVRSLFLYWFVGKNTTTHDHKVRIFKTSWDRVFHKVNHRWAYVIVSSLVGDSLRPGGMSAEETTGMLKEFIRQIVPAFQKSEMSETPEPQA